MSDPQAQSPHAKQIALVQKALAALSADEQPELLALLPYGVRSEIERIKGGAAKDPNESDPVDTMMKRMQAERDAVPNPLKSRR